MGKIKRPKLATHYSGPRAETRDIVSLDGRCCVGEGAEEEIAILDLDRGGCRVRGITAALTKADIVKLWLGPVGPVAARIRWAKRGSAGLKFEEPLSEEELEQASGAGVAPPAAGFNVVALRRRTAG